jgi:hypothetical protein
MTFSIVVFQAQVDQLLSADDDELPDVARSDQIEAAIERYSRDIPDEITADVTGDAGKYYPLAASLTAWSEGFSRILSIEYPALAVSADHLPQFIDTWNDDYWAGGTRYLFLPGHAPAATETMRIRYTAPYVKASNAYDIPPIDFNAVCQLATGYCCLAIATKYARTSDATISADSVDHAGRSERFRTQAQEWFRLYEEHIGLTKSLLAGGAGGEGQEAPAIEFVDFAKIIGLQHGRIFTR